MKIVPLVLAAALLPATAAHATVYKYTDKDGRVHYTDSPPEAAAKTEVKIERPEAPRKKADNWRDREQEMNARMIYAKNLEKDCEAARGRYAEMRDALRKNPKALIWFGSERITPGYLEVLEKDLERSCSYKLPFDIRY